MRCLIQAVTENITVRESFNVHLHTNASNVYVNSIDHLRGWLEVESREFHRKLREHIVEHDADTASRPSDGAAAGARVTITTFSLSETPPAKV